jgi:site-specific DNA recombinase
MKRCLVYLRVSSEKQRENYSLPSQREGCLQFAVERGWSVFGVEEEVFTSTERVRPRLSEVQRRAEEGEFDVLLVYAQDRLARKQRQLLRYLDEFDEDGVEVWSVLEGEFETDAFGTLKTSLYGFKSEQENEDRRERTMRGQRARAEQGWLLGAGPRPTYGYRWPTSDDERDRDGKLLKRRYEPDSETAPVVRQVFEWATAGHTLRSIANRLNDTGTPSPYADLEQYGTDQKWRHQTIKRILSNPFYRGEAWALSTHQRTKRKGTLQHEPVKLPAGVVPALISEAEWHRAQDVLVDRKPDRAASSPEDVLLRGGLVRCGNCNRAMTLRKRGKGSRTRYYACNKRFDEGRPCAKPSPTVKVEYVEEPVWALVRSVVLNPTRLWDRFHSEEQRQADEQRLAELEGRLAAVEGRRTRLLANLELLESDEVEELRPRLAALKEERDGLRAQLATLQERDRQREVRQHRFERLIGWSRLEVERVDSLTAEERRGLLVELGVVVRVFAQGAPDRWTVELGAGLLPTAEGYFDEDWDSVGEPTPAEQREWEQLQAEETSRGLEAGLVAAALAGSLSGTHEWDYWDLHMREALEQHARVLGIERIPPQRSREQGPIGG